MSGPLLVEALGRAARALEADDPVAASAALAAAEEAIGALRAAGLPPAPDELARARVLQAACEASAAQVAERLRSALGLAGLSSRAQAAYRR